MKLAKLVIRNFSRNRRRSVLATAGITLAVFVGTAVSAVEAGFASLGDAGGESVLNVYEKNVACALTSRVFDGYLAGIRSLPAVVGATGVLRGMYTYQRKENLVPVEGVEYETFRAIGGVRVDEGSEEGFVTRNDGALAGRLLARQYSWHVGQTVPMVEGLTVRLAGIFSSPDAARERELVLHKSFLASLQRDEGKSTYLLVRVSGASAVAPVSRSIDAALANAPRPTKTQSEKAAREQQSRDYDAIRMMLSGMVLATILASVFASANSVSMSVRERTREVGILRSLGFRRPHVVGILVGESLLAALIGGVVGTGASWALLASERLLGGIVPVVVRPGTAAMGLGMALVIGLLGALVPAVMAANSEVVDSLRVVD
jgi:putative ABC transport system permease protein